MTSHLAVVGRMALRGRPDLLYWLSVMCMTGAESDVYECLFLLHSRSTIVPAFLPYIRLYFQ